MRPSIKSPGSSTVCLTLAYMIAASACAPAKNGSDSGNFKDTQGAAQTESAIPAAPVVEKDSNGWPVVTKDVAQDKSVQFEQSEMPATEQERLRNEYRRTDLVQIPVDPKFNVNLFRINNVDEYKTAVFIAPRLFTYSSADGARVSAL